MDEYAITVSAYINKSIMEVSTTNNFIIRANKRPWMSEEVQQTLKAQNSAYKCGDKEALTTVRANLNHAIRQCDQKYVRLLPNSSLKKNSYNEHR